jgi:hypothetical protein
MKVKGKLYWVQDSVTINTKFNATNNKYQLTVGNLDVADVQELSDKFNIIAKEGKDEQGMQITAKSIFPFKFVDSIGNVFLPNVIYNGSEAVVEVTGSYDHAFVKKYGRGPSVGSTVVVTHLAEYEPKEMP